MKFVAITVLAFVAAALANPITISNNSIGDIVTVQVSANAVLTNNMEQNVLSIIAALLNQQAAVVSPGHALDEIASAQEELPELKDIEIPSEAIEAVKNFHISPELVEKFKNLMQQA